MMRKYRYWGMISVLGVGLALTLAGCGGGGSGSHSSSVGSDSSYTSSAVVTTLAGTGIPGSDNLIGTKATFSAPAGLALNSDKTYLYVADTGNSLIRTINILSKAVNTFYSSTLSGPEGLTFNGTDLYVCDTKNSAIRALNSGGTTISAFVNSGLSSPTGIVLDNSFFYVADCKNNVIRKISSSDTSGVATATTIWAGSTTFVSGYAGSAYHQTYNGTEVEFNQPYGVTVGTGTEGNYLYVTDSANNTIRKIEISSGKVSMLAGTHGTKGSSDSTDIDNTGETAYFNNPTGIAYYHGYLYVADTGNHIIRKVDVTTGAVTTIAGYRGHAGSASTTETTGNAAKFNSPKGIVSAEIDGIGVLFVADTGNNVIRKIVLAN